MQNPDVGRRDAAIPIREIPGMKQLQKMAQWIMPAASLVSSMPRGSLAADAERIEHVGVTYRIFRAKPQDIELHWKGEDGKPYAQFSRLQQALEGNGRDIQFMMNAGIFDPGGIPAGLHIKDGITLRPLNLREGKGNFYLKPNGVFCVADGKARMMESHLFAQSNLKPALAVQSGPLLLADGVIHPAFRAGSPNRKHRNGVGIAASGQVIFAITEFEPATNRVNLHGFARLFDHLGCRDALFLDGDLSEMIVNPAGPLPPGNRIGAMFAITRARRGS